ncbi:DUF2339 domain-containing protein [Azospirillum brasilense]|uniref:DUF2339 domain-containing protein n=1 Tax=Azospirillum brasilense TaxID=192 RepID=UPI0003A6252A|nr:DUF2339 domain-containing protein [Azospirillum brasilense]
MQGWTEGYVGGIGYIHAFYRELSPALLSFALTLRGWRPPMDSDGTFACAEIGCGHGVSSAVLAGCHPDARFEAVDFNPGHIAGAQRLAAEAGLGNAAFREESFAEYAQGGAKDLDIVTLHGVWSWVSAENRAILVDLLKRRLKPGGLVFVSYNALPGTLAYMPLRRVLVEHCADRTGPLPERIEEAVAFASRLTALNAGWFAQADALPARLDSLKRKSPNYIAHEYLNRDWTAFYHADVARELAAAKLDFAGPAVPMEQMDELSLPPDALPLLAEARDPAYRETLRDLLTNRAFRRDLFVKGAERLTPAERRDRLRATRFALLVPPGDLPEVVLAPVGRVPLPQDLHGPLAEALAAGTPTLAELSALPALARHGEEAVLRALMILTSLALAALLVAGTGPLARHRHQPGVGLGLAAFAAGAVGALSLGAVMMLREAWLTVALAAQVPVLAWLERRMGLRSLRAVILLVAGAVLVRLALNPSVLEYGEDGLGWVVYGYGLPAAGFFLAAHWLRSAPDGKGDDGVVALLEAGGLAFVTLLLSLGIQALTRGTLDEPPDTLREVALHTLVWLALALLLATGRRWRARPVAVWGRRILAGLAALQAAALHLVALNPLWSDEAVGAWPVANTLLLAYGLPALLGLLFLWVEPLPARLRPWVALLPLMLLGMNLALEIRHAFQGPVLSGPDLPDAEWYGYSVGFLVAAVLMLVAALRYRLGWLRHAAMALILAVVAKVFLSDMAELGGLYRVASFLGLGLSLIGVGYLYRRLQGTAPQGGQTVA